MESPIFHYNHLYFSATALSYRFRRLRPPRYWLPEPDSSLSPTPIPKNILPICRSWRCRKQEKWRKKWWSATPAEPHSRWPHSSPREACTAPKAALCRSRSAARRRRGAAGACGRRRWRLILRWPWMPSRKTPSWGLVRRQWWEWGWTTRRRRFLRHWKSRRRGRRGIRREGMLVWGLRGEGGGGSWAMDELNWEREKGRGEFLALHGKYRWWRWRWEEKPVLRSCASLLWLCTQWRWCGHATSDKGTFTVCVEKDDYEQGRS